MADVWMKVEGAEELKQKLLRLPDEFMEAMTDELTAAGNELTAAGAQAAPRLSGDLQSSATFKTKTRQQRKSFTFIGILNAEHAAAVHEGVFGGVEKTGKPSFKWWAKIFMDREASVIDRVVRRLRGVADGGGK